jgi:hypothetical protein
MIILLAISCTTSEALQSETVTADYKTTGARVTGLDTIYLAVRPFESGGRLALCVAHWENRFIAYGQDITSEILSRLGVALDGEHILHDLTQIPSSGATPGYGGRATCLRTTVPWRPAFETAQPSVDFSGQRIVVRV